MESGGSSVRVGLSRPGSVWFRGTKIIHCVITLCTVLFLWGLEI
jgi:hypothetical protein